MSDLNTIIKQVTFPYKGIHRESTNYDDTRHPRERDQPLPSDPKSVIRFSLTFQRGTRKGKETTAIRYTIEPAEELRYQSYQAVRLSRFEEEIMKQRFRDPEAGSLTKILGNYFWESQGPFIEFNKEHLASKLEKARPKSDPNSKIGYIHSVTDIEWSGLLASMFEDWREEINNRIANPVLFVYRGYGIYTGMITKPLAKDCKTFELRPQSRRLVLLELKGKQCGFSFRDVEPTRQDYPTEYTLSRVTQMYSLYKLLRQD